MEERNCAYLRKSRADYEAELHGEGETLLRHQNELIRVAKRMGTKIDKFYREIVSGETIAERPAMIQLLKDIEAGLWDNIFVIEVERLARGDSFDQAYITKAFKYSNTKIVTPSKVFYPQNESDEEYFEFSLFMSRREYKVINKRLNNGRIASVREGKYAGNIAPYGFKREKIKGDKGFILVPNEEEIETCILIFELYGNNPELSIHGLAEELNRRKIKPRIAEEWSLSSLKDILSNPAVIGKLRWNRRKGVKKLKEGEIQLSRPRNDDYILSDGLHKPIITLDLWEKVQEKLKRNAPRVPHNYNLVNPFSGIIKCELCGKNMVRRPHNKRNMPASLICTNKKCKNVSTKMYLVEEKILEILKTWCQEYNIEYKTSSDSQTMVDNVKQKIKKVKMSISKEESILDGIFSKYEEGIYSHEVFVNRQKVRKDNILKMETELKELNKNLESLLQFREEQNNFIPTIKNILDLYDNQQISVEKKQILLKQIIEKVTYLKTEKVRHNEKDDKFILKVYPKIPKISKD